MASASVLQRLNQRTKEAENIISELKGQIENLRQSAGTTFIWLLLNLIISF